MHGECVDCGEDFYGEGYCPECERIRAEEERLDEEEDYDDEGRDESDYS